MERLDSSINSGSSLTVRYKKRLSISDLRDLTFSGSRRLSDRRFWQGRLGQMAIKCAPVFRGYARRLGNEASTAYPQGRPIDCYTDDGRPWLKNRSSKTSLKAVSASLRYLRITFRRPRNVSQCHVTRGAIRVSTLLLKSTKSLGNARRLRRALWILKASLKWG